MIRLLVHHWRWNARRNWNTGPRAIGGGYAEKILVGLRNGEVSLCVIWSKPGI